MSAVRIYVASDRSRAPKASCVGPEKLSYLAAPPKDTVSIDRSETLHLTLQFPAGGRVLTKSHRHPVSCIRADVVVLVYCCRRLFIFHIGDSTSQMACFDVVHRCHTTHKGFGCHAIDQMIFYQNDSIS